ncbi:hypothetical protein [Geobacter benzoatilyticus]|uniref:DUF5666 domain-containing protein n=1 Tax=Geobacter benzoatilyticus TaxID=2815309 RepID=A0ABX7PZU0_9BACT|nr:hypothetical protein [Geobacter benzoatilyticus]QSV44666.1 hypothetical protein JZM60_10850 [Geobacter benzoatilyticus]
MRYLMVMVAGIVFWGHYALAAQEMRNVFPSLSSLGATTAGLMSPEVVEGEIMAIRGAGTFVMREKLYRICRETEVNGTPAPLAKFTLKKGTRVKATVYRIRNKTYFVSELEIR